MEATLSQGFVNIFRNLPIAGPLIEEIQDTDPRERLKYAIKRLIVSCELVAVASGTLPSLVDLSKCLEAAFHIASGISGIGGLIIGLEYDYFPKVIDNMNDEQFNKYYTYLACGPLAPWLFDSKALKKVLESAWKKFEPIMGKIRKSLSKVFDIDWDAVDSEIGLDLENIIGVAYPAYAVCALFPTLGIVMLPGTIGLVVQKSLESTFLS